MLFSMPLENKQKNQIIVAFLELFLDAAELACSK